ncbi:hypothetical protein L484_007763 [Morus notabilis]|uniref:Uncharacterized protein n=1 Tax=Morus notabilis TaxID=981085 RepID=W9RKD0_9ROSA|nr:hypothetical protein L484_007763 [Morus notabilis]
MDKPLRFHREETMAWSWRSFLVAVVESGLVFHGSVHFCPLALDVESSLFLLAKNFESFENDTK